MDVTHDQVDESIISNYRRMVKEVEEQIALTERKLRDLKSDLNWLQQECNRGADTDT